MAKLECHPSISTFHNIDWDDEDASHLPVAYNSEENGTVLKFYIRIWTVWLTTCIAGCGIIAARDPVAPDAYQAPTLTPPSITYRDLTHLPPPKGKILAAVYGFRDQTGQYKRQPASNFSTAVTQGGASMLVKALLDSGWFIPVEREGLQNLLTERKIIRATLKGPDADSQLPSLLSANILLEGGIVAYDTNVMTGGSGARYFGIGASDQYRVDQVTVSLRAVDVRAGRVLADILTTKTVYSYQLDTNLYRFVSFSRLLEAEGGFSRNEPSQLCVLNALEAAVIHLIASGIRDKLWELGDPEAINSPIFQSYLDQQREMMEIPSQPTRQTPTLDSDESGFVFGSGVPAV